MRAKPLILHAQKAKAKIIGRKRGRRTQQLDRTVSQRGPEGRLPSAIKQQVTGQQQDWTTDHRDHTLLRSHSQFHSMDGNVVDGGGLPSVCANCGTGREGATIKLKDCTACRLVKYCSLDCQKAHRKQHEKACKQRAVELKDEQLYSQGLERSEDDFCPICTLPIPLPMFEHSITNCCCMKRICHGCDMASKERGRFDCPFCRTRYPDGEAGMLAQVRARAKKKDPNAIGFLGDKYGYGDFGLPQDMKKAVEHWEEAAELGDLDSIFNLGNSYSLGMGVQVDKTKAVQLWENAAMQGHVESRINLGSHEVNRKNYGRAVKHFLLSSKMGDKESVELIRKIFMKGHATKAQYAEALRGYQNSLDETKSPQRDRALDILRKLGRQGGSGQSILGKQFMP